MNNKIVENLEEMIDCEGIDTILTYLSLICFEKAEHSVGSFSDAVLANYWGRMSSRLAKIDTTY